MIGGLLRRALREGGPATLGFGVGLLILEVFLAYVLPTYAGEFEDALLKITFVRNFLGALLGTRIEEGFALSIAQGLPWVHPAVLVVAWGHELVFCTRVPVGEIDRGTVDLLLSLPFSRWQLWIAETIAWIAAGAFLLLLGLTGFALGTLAAGGSCRRPDGSSPCSPTPPVSTSPSAV